MALALAASYPVSTSGATSTTTPSFTPATGELLVLKIVTEDAGTPVSSVTATGGGITWTSRVADTTSGHVAAYIYTGTVTAGGSAITVTANYGGSGGHRSMVLERWTGAQLATTPATTDTRGSGAPSGTVTTVAADSVVSWASGDWNAVSGSSRTYRSSATEESYVYNAGAYTAYYAYQSAPTAGMQTTGLTAPSGQLYSIVGVEVQPSAVAGTTVSPTGISSSEAFGSPQIWTTTHSDFDDGTAQGWSTSTGGAGTVAITNAAAHDGAYGVSADVPAATTDKAAYTRPVSPTQQATIRGWWKVTTEGASSSSNVPFARMFYGGQRLADVYRQNQQAAGAANVWLRVVKAAGGSSYYYIPTGYSLPVGTWVYMEFTWGLDGIPRVSIDGVEYIGDSKKPADWFAAPQIDTVYLGSHEPGNQGAWAQDTVDVITAPYFVAGEIRPANIEGAEGFGAPSVTISTPVIAASPAGIASGEAAGTPSVSTILATVPTGIASAGAVGTPTIAATLSAQPTGIATAGAVGTPAASTTITLSPMGLASGGAFGVPAVAGAITTSPSGIASAETLGAPALNSGLTISLTGIATAEAAGTPALTATLAVAPPGIASAEAFGTPNLGNGLDVTPAGIASAQAFGLPVITAPRHVDAVGIASLEAFGTPSVATPITASPAGITTTEAFGVPRAASSQQSSPAGIATAEAFGTPALSARLTASPAGMASAAAFGTPTATVVDTHQTVGPSGIASSAAFGAPLATGPRTIGPVGIPSLEAFGTPSQSNVLVAFPADIPSLGALFGAPEVRTTIALGPAGVPSREAVGQPTLIKVALILGPPSIISLEAFGVPKAEGGSANVPYEMAGSIQPRRNSGRLGGPGTTSQIPRRWEGTLG